MAIYRLQCEFAGDTTLARDVFSINPHFNTNVTSDPDQLCEDLATALDTYTNNTGARQITVTAYDAQGTKPVYPVGTAQRNTGLSPVSNCPREVSVCLSYFSGRNIPRRRGRLYLPFTVLGFGPPDSVRPQAGVRTKVGQLAPILADLGGINVDWVVFSRADNASFPVSNWWVDDEWDTVRSRGLKPSDRTTGTVNE